MVQDTAKTLFEKSETASWTC